MARGTVRQQLAGSNIFMTLCDALHVLDCLVSDCYLFYHWFVIISVCGFTIYKGQRGAVGDRVLERGEGRGYHKWR